VEGNGGGHRVDGEVNPPDDRATAPPEPAAARTFTLTFDNAGCLPPLRGILRMMLAGSPADRIADAELVCTELVVNALEHATGPRVSRLRLDREELLRIAVVDGSPERPVTIGTSRLGPHRGRGMVLVDRIAMHWYVTTNATTKAVRAVLAPA
jgi:anti-sigma regulatory factor (Ser/Thr protein kinase)